MLPLLQPAPMETTSAPPVAPSEPPVSTVTSDGLSEKERLEQEMRQSLLAKQQELLQIQQQRLELELEQTKARLAAQVTYTLNSLTFILGQKY